MSFSAVTTVLLITLQIFGFYCSNSRRVIERIKYLETRISTESQFRDEEYADIIDRLDEIDKRLNASTEQRISFINSDHKTSNVNTETEDHLRKDFMRIRTAFREEKSETARMRRQIPRIENDLTAVKHDLEYYCTINVNKTDELMSMVEISDDVRKSDMEKTINEINEVKTALEKDFKGTVEEIEESMQSTVKELKILEGNTRQEIAETKAKVERIESLVSQLSARLEHLFLPDSCYKTLGSGVYKLQNGLNVFCDQTTDGGGWTVFQRRQNGEVDFYRNWNEYKNGFGDLNGEFWLGNEHLSILTATGDHELRIDMEDFEGNKAYAKYSKFKVYPEEDKYKLEVSGYSGNAGDSLKYHNGMAFTTFDNDNDKHSSLNCAIYYHGAWWYKTCYHSNLNGQYFNDPGKIDDKGITWHYWKNSYYCLKSVEMKFHHGYGYVWENPSKHLTMPLSISKRAVLIVFCIIGVYCSNSKRVIERIKHLESRFNTESKFRDEDYAEVIDRLDEIDKKLNGSLEKRVDMINSDQASSDVNTETVDQIREDFTRIRKAFREEKSETARIRREIPRIENDLIAVKHDLGYYCTINVNKTDELMSRVEISDDVRKSDMEMTINEINEVKTALENTINATSILVGQDFKGTAEEIEESMQSTVKELKILEGNTRQEIAETKAKVERIESLVSQLSARLEHLFLGDSCYGTLRSGVYTLQNGLQVFCDQTTDGGDWTVFQRRQNGEVDFYRNWKEYKNGFGDLFGEFWLGNEYLSILTATGDHELRIDMEDFDGNKAYAKYSKFRVYPEEDKYKLEVSGYSGNAGDSLKYHNGMAFTTFDNDNDKWSYGNCAIRWHGAWWYKSCYYSNLNGQYFNDPGKIDGKGITWHHWKNKKYCLKSVEMKFR
ncbi:uncharacterized protein LOC123543147 [Mercenaria mercenaria]|uniref:uncharacterized protein LOC123543147 n=1 Tax=Mercenaria mercenaria TaxID=6596 RepID=UPI00234E9D52|nr:uncharacterized protein LOC123543147 [Mercenaria mercenaria]